MIELFVRRRVATLLLSLSVVLLGWLGYNLMPVAPLPQVAFPTIVVSASLSGASPETMAATVASPLERAMGQIAGITEMTSSSSQGSTSIIIQFDLSRDINGAARDVQAAINSARSLLPSSMNQLPTYHKANPSNAPILMLAMTSPDRSTSSLYQMASNELEQKIAQVSGVGEVTLRGSALPAVRVDMNPQQLSHYGIALSTVASAIKNATTSIAKGSLQGENTHWWIEDNGQMLKASSYRQIVVSYHSGKAVTLGDVAHVYDSVQSIYTSGYYNNRPAIALQVTQSSDANVLQTVDAIKALLPSLQAQLPSDVHLNLVIDRSTTIRSSLHSTEETLVLAVGLVILVVLLFLRNWRAMIIPAIALPVSLVGSCAVMYILGFSLDNLSLMALIVATGFVVDDAIVVLENISRHLEEGMRPLQAAIQGAKEVGFTVLAMTLSLIAVFIPILLMGGIIGRLFREFAVTLSVSLVVSLIVSLTLTPMLCSLLLKGQDGPAMRGKGLLAMVDRAIERVLSGLAMLYHRSLLWALEWRKLVLFILLATIGLNGYLYMTVQKGFFPDQDTGILMGMLRMDQGTSYQALSPLMQQYSEKIRQNPAVESVVASAGSGHFGSRNTANFFITLKSLNERSDSAQEIANQLTALTRHSAGAHMFFMPAQDLHIGGRSANATYQYSLQSDSLSTLQTWTPKVYAALQKLPQLSGVDSDAQNGGPEAYLEINRNLAKRYGITPKLLDTFLGNAFAESDIAKMYQLLNQYYVVLDVMPIYAQSPETLKQLYVINDSGERIPLSAFCQFRSATAPLSVNHQNQTATSTIAFNLTDGYSLEQAEDAIQQTIVKLGLPDAIHTSYSGTAQAFQSLLSTMPWLILAALITMYIVLGMLYENLIHPITILSTLPSAGIGALLLMMMTDTQLTVIALIGVLLLIGIVKKNAIMMVDFAIDYERSHQSGAEAAIIEACRLRFRPILMTSLAAFFGALPMMLESRGDAGLRQPLGIAICGGLLVSQVLTLYTTPVVYLYLDRFGQRVRHWWQHRVMHHSESHS